MPTIFPNSLSYEMCYSVIQKFQKVSQRICALRFPEKRKDDYPSN